jgi:hypothetical protein
MKGLICITLAPGISDAPIGRASTGYTVFHGETAAPMARNVHSRLN